MSKSYTRPLIRRLNVPLVYSPFDSLDARRGIAIVGVEWNKVTDTYLRLTSHLPPLAASLAWDKVADTYTRPERG